MDDWCPLALSPWRASLRRMAPTRHTTAVTCPAPRKNAGSDDGSPAKCDLYTVAKSAALPPNPLNSKPCALPWFSSLKFPTFASNEHMNAVIDPCPTNQRANAAAVGEPPEDATFARRCHPEKSKSAATDDMGREPRRSTRNPLWNAMLIPIVPTVSAMPKDSSESQPAFSFRATPQAVTE